MMSWKTTVCGLLALVGGALAQFFPEYAKLGGFFASVGSGAGLLFARDNNVTSEEAIGKKSLPPSLLLCALAGLLILPACQFLPGRTNQEPAPTAQAVKYFELADTRALVDAAMRTYGEAVVLGKVHPADEAKIDVAHATFQVAFKTAVRAAFYDVGTITPDNVRDLALQLVTLIQTLEK